MSDTSVPAGPAGSRWFALLDEAGVRILQGLALGVALVVAPGFLGNVVDLPKRLWVEGLVILGWWVLVSAAPGRGGVALKATPLVAPFLGVLGVLVASGALSANPGLAWESAGLVLAWGGLVLFAASLPDPAARPRVAGALLLAGGLEAVYGILQYAGIDILPWASSWGSRCFGTIGNPVFFAEFLAPLFVLGVALLVAEEDEERKDLLGLLVLVEFLALVFAQTRSAWLGSAAGLAVLAVALARGGSEARALVARNRTWLMALGGFAVAVVLTISSSTVFGRNALPLKDRVRDMFNMKGWTVQHRLVLWRAAGLIVRSSPVLGAGPEQFGSRFPLAQATFRPAYAKKGFFFPPKEQRAHNDYVQWAAEVGVVGLGLMLWLFAVVGKVGWRAVEVAGTAQDRACAGGLLGGCVVLAVDAAFNFPFRVIPAAAVFWLFAGLLAERASSRWWRPSWKLPAAAGRLLPVVAAAVAAVWIGWLAWPAIRADRAQSAGDSFLGSGFYERAMDAFEQSLASRPHDAIVHYQFGLACWNAATFDWTGHTWDRALVEFDEALRLGLHDELLYARLAMLYERKGKLAAAAREGELAARIYPEQGDHLANLAYWYAQRGRNLAEALDLADRAVAMTPRHPLYHWTRGLVLEQLERTTEALRELRAAVPLLPNVLNGAAFRPDLDRDVARVAAKAGDSAPRPAPVPSSDLRTF
ncbi:MAG: O-antigen ligase family protein [Candidatus Coatesbacteria bacterium]